MQFFESARLKMQCNKLRCMQNDHYAFKMDLDAKMKNQRGKHAIQ